MLNTEKRNPNTTHISEMGTLEMMKVIQEENKRAAAAIDTELDAIAEAVDAISERMKRGGRLSSATALVGSVLMIKPILTANAEGKLFAWGKARGKRGAHDELLRRFDALAHDPENSLVFISHSDCMEQAVNLDMQLRAKWDVKDTIITDIGPAFGAHCGPGAVAVFFIGRETASPDETAEDTTDTESNTRE